MIKFLVKKKYNPNFDKEKILTEKIFKSYDEAYSFIHKESLQVSKDLILDANIDDKVDFKLKVDEYNAEIYYYADDIFIYEYSWEIVPILEDKSECKSLLIDLKNVYEIINYLYSKIMDMDTKKIYEYNVYFIDFIQSVNIYKGLKKRAIQLLKSLPKEYNRDSRDIYEEAEQYLLNVVSCLQKKRDLNCVDSVRKLLVRLEKEL